MMPGINNKPFEILVGEKVFEKDDILKMPKQPEIFDLTKWGWVNKVLAFFGFNIAFDMLVMSEGVRSGEGYNYRVKLRNKWYCWYSFKLFKTKINER